jgi:hypothetical protein
MIGLNVTSKQRLNTVINNTINEGLNYEGTTQEVVHLRSSGRWWRGGWTVVCRGRLLMLGYLLLALRYYWGGHLRELMRRVLRWVCGHGMTCRRMYFVLKLM